MKCTATTSLLLAAAIVVSPAAQARSVMDSFNRAYRDGAGLSTPQERSADRVEDLLEEQRRLMEEQRRQQEELRWDVHRLQQRLR